MFSDVWFWMTVVFALLLALALFLHFRNPYPLIQIPELPHHLYFLPEKERRAIADICTRLGHKLYGVFGIGGADQLLFQNGTTVLALRNMAAQNTLPMLALPVTGDVKDAVEATARWLRLGEIRFEQSVVPGSGDLITRFVLSDFGFGIALKPTGREMQKHFGLPKFIRWQWQ